ncbi:MAG TPA: hypothetical protein VN622_09360 [Clostridia bacterium]|nr:hypothetical protein [Clostridia bacterium]
MTHAWKTIRGYIWWTHPRGNLHYDIMVTLILVFIFVTPLFVNFKDKPAERTPHPTGVVVLPDGKDGFIYRVDAAAVHGTSDDAIRQGLISVIEPIAGEVKLLRYEAVQDLQGRVIAYRVWVRRGIGG